MKSNKGFTLIELLAVIVVLAIIALIATPMVLNIIDEAKEGAVQSSAYSVISAVENQIAINMISDSNLDYSVWTDTNLSIKGTDVKSISLAISEGVVTNGTIVLENGVATVEDGKVTAATVSQYTE